MELDGFSFTLHGRSKVDGAFRLFYKEDVDEPIRALEILRDLLPPRPEDIGPLPDPPSAPVNKETIG